MNLKSNFLLVTRFTIAFTYLWVVADRLSFLGPAGEMGVVWGNFESFLEYTASLNPWFPRSISDILGYIVTVLEVILALLLISGIRLKETSLISLLLLVVFTLSMTFSIGFINAIDFIAFTLVLAAASGFIFVESLKGKDF